MDGNTSNSYRLRGKSRKSHDSRSSEINNNNSIDGSDSASKKTLRQGEVRITRAQANKKSKVGVATKQDTSMTKKYHAADILSTVTLSEEEEDDEVDIEVVSSPIKMDNTPTRVLNSCHVNVNTQVDMILPLTHGVLVKRVTPRKTSRSRVLAEVDDENSDAGISVKIKEVEKKKKEGDEEEDGGVDGDEEEEDEEEWEKEEIEKMEEENLEQEEDGVVQCEEEETNGSTYIYHMFPGRKQQISILLSLMGKPLEWVTPALYVYGHTGVGKTLVIKNIMIKSQVPHAYVDMIECYSPRILFETILNQLSGTLPSSSNNYIGYVRCDNLPQFIRELCQLSTTQEWNESSVYIVLDHAERLRKMEPTLLPALLRLAELSNLNLCTILISQLVWEKYATSTGCYQPLVLYFPEYKKDEVLEILSLDCPSEYSKDFYHTFLTSLWNVMNSISKDISELRHISDLLFPIYCEPIKSGQATEKETWKLWRHVEPYYKNILPRLYIRESTSLNWIKEHNKGERVLVVAKGPALPSSSTEHNLPYFTKYLMIAAYLSSYNPVKTDRKFFSKGKSMKGKSKVVRHHKEELKRQLIGPRPFSLERMMTIFHSITEEDVIPTACLYSQISTLVTLHLLAKVSSGDVLDVVKYKCLVTFEVIREISKSINFEIVRYLYDYSH